MDKDDLKGIFITKGLDAELKQRLCQILHDAGYKWASGDSLLDLPIGDSVVHIDTDYVVGYRVTRSWHMPGKREFHKIIDIATIFDGYDPYAI